MKKLLALLFATMMLFTVVGCEQKAETPASTEAPVETEASATDITGTYILTSGLNDGEKIPLEMLPQLSCTLNEDHTGTYENGGGEIQIQWTQEGNTVTFTAVGEGPSDPFVLTVEGNTLTATDGASAMVFTKQ